MRINLQAILDFHFLSHYSLNHHTAQKRENWIKNRRRREFHLFLSFLSRDLLFSCDKGRRKGKNAFIISHLARCTMKKGSHRPREYSILYTGSKLNQKALTIFSNERGLRGLTLGKVNFFKSLSNCIDTSTRICSILTFTSHVHRFSSSSQYFIFT